MQNIRIPLMMRKDTKFGLQIWYTSSGPVAWSLLFTNVPIYKVTYAGKA